MISENEFLFKKDKKNWYLFKDPLEIIVENNVEKVFEKLEYINSMVEQGCYVAGFLSYEACSAFDDKFKVKENRISPVLWFAIYETREEISHESIFTSKGKNFSFNWNYPIKQKEYVKVIEEIRKAISDGDIYQQNYTFLMESDFDYDPFTVFSSLFANLDSPYMAFVETENFAVLSSSPELFFSLEGSSFVAKPMKGTIERGRTLEEDDKKRNILSSSIKDQAENVMIVDMIRNDIGKIAEPSSVLVENLFEIEKYDRVFQMTTKVKAEVLLPFSHILKAMFPCASITGAPKIRSMDYIEKFEKRERGLYTGAIGYVSPDEALFNVAIRTMFVKKDMKKAFYGTGGGIVWDSSPEKEFAECRDKALVVENPETEFKLLETMLYIPGKGFFIEELHRKRLLSSVEYFSFDIDVDKLNRLLNDFESVSFARVRLLCDRFGNLELQSFPLDRNPLMEIPSKFSTEWKVALSDEVIDSSNRFLFHKTTNRKLYEDILGRYKNFDDVIFFNEKDEITESCFANFVLEMDGNFFTPFQSSGLLCGTMRQYLLNKKMIIEKKLKREDIFKADGIWLLNSVRGWIRAKL